MEPLIVFNPSIFFIHYVQNTKKNSQSFRNMADHSLKTRMGYNSESRYYLTEYFVNQKEEL